MAAPTPPTSQNERTTTFIRGTCATSTSGGCVACNVSPSAKNRSATPLAAEVPSNTSMTADASTTINARLALRAQPGRRERRSYRGAAIKADLQLRDGWAFCHVPNFAQEAIGRQHTGLRSPCLRLATEIFGNVAQLHHRCRVSSIQACGPHVAALLGRWRPSSQGPVPDHTGLSPSGCRGNVQGALQRDEAIAASSAADSHRPAHVCAATAQVQPGPSPEALATTSAL